MKGRNRKSILIVSFIIVVLVYIGYSRMGQNVLEELEAEEVESVRLTGTTGGLDGEFEYVLSDSEADSFIELLNQVQLGGRVSEEMARSAGAVSYYAITYRNGEKLLISPGAYFLINDKYYTFKNYDELWDEFFTFNSMR